MSKRISIVGYYGYDNLGDDLMLISLLESIEKMHPKPQVTLLAKESENLKSIVKKFKSINLIFFREKDKIGNFKKYIKSIIKSDLTLWGGGTCFSEEDGVGNFKYFLINILCFRRFAYIGIGIGNLTNRFSIVKAKILFKFMSFATFRDAKSFSKAKQLTANNNIFLTNDLAYLSEFHLKENNLKNYMLISLRDLAKYYSPDILKERYKVYKLFFEKIADEENLKLIFCPIDNMKDKNVNIFFYQELQKEGFNVKFIDDSDYENKIQLILNSKINFTERLHSIVISKLSGGKCIPISYSPKINRFLKDLNDNNFISYNEKVTFFKLNRLYKSIIVEKQKEEDSMLIEKHRAIAHENIKVLKKFL